jgi:hypothetical protein
VSCTVSINFDPKSTGAKKATLVLKDSDPTSPQVVSITGTGTSYESFTPASVTFSTVELDGTTSKSTKIEFKYSGSGTLTMTGVTASAGFTVNTTGVSPPCNLTSNTAVTKTTPCYFNVAFAPGTAIGTVNGNATASFTDPNDANTSLQLPLTGTATEVSLSPATLAFGTVSSGTKNETLTVTNKGATTLTFSGTPTVTGTGSAQFTVLGTSTCLTLGSIGPSGTCTFIVQFTSTGGSISYTNYLNIADNGGASPQLEKMTAKD